MRTPRTPRRRVTVDRYWVHTVRSGVPGRPVRDPYWVVDAATALPVDAYCSKRAAVSHARLLNRGR